MKISINIPHCSANSPLNDLNGKTIQLEIEKSDTIKNIKTKVHTSIHNNYPNPINALVGVDVDRIRLLLGDGVEISDDSKSFGEVEKASNDNKCDLLLVLKLLHPEKEIGRV